MSATRSHQPSVTGIFAEGNLDGTQVTGNALGQVNVHRSLGLWVAS